MNLIFSHSVPLGRGPLIALQMPSQCQSGCCHPSRNSDPVTWALTQRMKDSVFELLRFQCGAELHRLRYMSMRGPGGRTCKPHSARVVNSQPQTIMSLQYTCATDMTVDAACSGLTILFALSVLCAARHRQGVRFEAACTDSGEALEEKLPGVMIIHMMIIRNSGQPPHRPTITP